MTKARLVIITSLLLATLSVTYAWDGPWCGKSYRYESFALGLDEGFTGRQARPTVLDEMCFKLGKAQGELLLKHDDLRDCKEAFNKGEKRGLLGDTINTDFPMECHNAGNAVGTTKLSLQARADWKNSARTACGKKYGEGREDALNLRVATYQYDHKENHCYQTGYSDALLFGTNIN